MIFDYDVFLSFASDDEEVVRPLWERLCLSGLKVFWSDATLKQKLGESWFDSIQNALERSRHFVLVVSSSSMTSEWVKREYKAFYNHCYQAGARRLVPVLAGTFHVSKLPLLLKDLQVSHLNKPGSIDTLISLLGGEDFSALRVRLAKLESQNHILLEQLARLRIDGAAAHTANAPGGTQDAAKKFTWEQISRSAGQIGRKIFKEFKPDFIITFAGPPALFTSLAMMKALTREDLLRTRFYTALYQNKGSSLAPLGLQGYETIESLRFVLHVPRLVGEIPSRSKKRVCVIECTVTTGSVLETLKKHLVAKGYKRGNIRYACCVCASDAYAEPNTRPDYCTYKIQGKYRLPWGEPL